MSLLLEMMTMTNIKDLYLRYQETNLESDFDTLYRALWKLCVTIVGKHPDAEDIASDVAIPLGIKLCKRELSARGLYTYVQKLVDNKLRNLSRVEKALKNGGIGRAEEGDSQEKPFCTRCQAEGHDIESHFEASQFDPVFHTKKCDLSVAPYELTELPAYLTEQERRFALAVAYGHTFQEWATSEGVTLRTVQNIRDRILSKSFRKSV